ncbi:pentapeptide repeat-containing protein [Nostoc sp.]
MLCKPGVEKCNNLTNADLGKANLTGVNLDRANFTAVDLERVIGLRR